MAAIRSYADNARVLLQRNKPIAVADNLATIASLTERISTIIEDLRAFARKRTGGLEATVVARSIEARYCCSIIGCGNKASASSATCRRRIWW